MTPYALHNPNTPALQVTSSASNAPTECRTTISLSLSLSLSLSSVAIMGTLLAFSSHSRKIIAKKKKKTFKRELN